MTFSTPAFLRPRSHRFALESRQLFDGAAIVEAASQAEAPHADAAPAEAHHAPVAQLAPLTPGAAQRDVATEAGHGAPALPAPSVSHEVYVVDKNVADWQQLVAAVPAGAQLVLLDPGSSGVQQLADALQGQTGITAIHILSHGSAGEITLGNERVDTASLGQSAAAWQAIGASLSADGDILLYGCDVAADGEQFSHALGNLTGADVASSSDATGAASRGADWALESATGTIEARSFADANFDGVLAAPTVNTTATGLTVAETSSLNAAGADRATLTGWTITDDGSGNVTVDVVVEDPSRGTLSSASTTGVTSVAGGYRFTGTVANANAWVNQLVFTSADVELGNSAASTRIVVTVTDSETPALTATRALNVTITPSNDPTSVADSTQSVNEIGSTVLSVATLNALDAEVSFGTQVPSQVVYSLAVAPTYGYLALDGNRLGIGAVFTQQDVIDGRVAYVHTATEANQNTPDSFGVRVNDGATPTARSDTATISLNVTPLNQAPSVSGAGNVFEGQPANALDVNGLPASVVGNFIVAEGGGDDADSTLTVQLTSLPTDGTLFFSGTVSIGGVSQLVSNRTVTQADINAGFVFAYTARSGLTYSNTGNRDSDVDPVSTYPFTDGFGVTLADGGGGAGAGAVQTASTTIAINVRPVDDDPTFDPLSTLQATVTAVGTATGPYTVTLTAAMLNAFDVDSADDRLTIAVTSQAGLDQGQLLLNGQRLPNGGTFTVADVKAGRVQYVQVVGAGPNQTDNFQFQVLDGTVAVHWNADGTRVERNGGVYSDNATPGNYNDDSLRTFNFTINLAETPAGNGGTFTPIGTATARGESTYGGTDATGNSRGTLVEGGTLTLAGTGSDFSITPGLSYTADGVPPSQVIYTVLAFEGSSSGEWNGALQRFNGTAWVDLGVYDTFTQADLNAGSIRFVHDGASEDFQSNVQLSASAGVLVSDGAGGLRPDAWVTSFTFYATPINDAPETVGSSNTVIPEGGTAYITTGQLQITDPDDAVSEGYLEAAATLPGSGDPDYAFNNAASGAGALQFEVMTLPTGGTLQYSTNGGASWIDVTAGQHLDAALITGTAGTTGLRFVSDGSEVRSTTFAVRAVDRWGATSNTANVGIQITNVNDAPQIAPDPTQADPATSVNNPLTVAEGGYAQISTSMLTAFDPDSSTTQVQYTITGAAAHGNIAYSTDGITFLSLGVGSSFSQADVALGRIYYLHSGDESNGASYPTNPPGDSFSFSLGDGDKEQPGNQFWIYVTPANDAPVVTGPAGPIAIDSATGTSNPVSGFSVADTDFDTPTAGETDFLQVTVRLQDAAGNAFDAAAYAGVTISSSTFGGVTVDGDKNGAGDYLTLRGTRAQVNAALAGLNVTFSTDRDTAYQVQVIADDRLRNAGTGALLGGANGGPVNEADPAGAPGIAVPATEFNWYSAAVPTTGDITGNVSAAAVRIHASSQNDPGTLGAPASATVNEDQATYIGGGFVVADPESAGFDTPITVRLNVPSGTLGIGGAGTQSSVTPGGGQAVSITGDNTGALVLTGRASDIQALLNGGTSIGLTYRSAANVNDDINGAAAGDVTLTVSFDDTGSRIGDDVGAGSVANNPADVNVALTIAPVNDAPTVTLTGGVTSATPVTLTGGATPTAVAGFQLGDIDIDGDIATNGAASDVTDGEVDFLQVTVRITDAAGNALPSTSYDGTNGDITITSSNGASGVTIDGTYDGTGSALVISGTRAQVQAYLDGLAVALHGNLTNGDVMYRVEVIADDRVRDGGGVVTGANGGQNDNAGNGTTLPAQTAVNPYAATPGGLAANVASTYRTLFPSSINDPAHIAAGNLAVDEGGSSVTLSGITVTDQDALATSVLTTTVSVPAGFTITGIGAGTGGSASIAGDGLSVSITGTLAQINSRINTIAVQLPDAPGTPARTDWNGAFAVTIVVDDQGNTGGRPGSLASGDNSTTGTFAYQDGTAADLITTRTINFTVNAVNDAPVRVNGSTETLAAVNEDAGSGAAGATVATLFGSHFSDAADQIDNSGTGATGGTSADGFFGVAITGVTLNPAQGAWQYSLDGSNWFAVGARGNGNALVLAATAQLRFVPAADFHGTPNALTVRLVETDTNNDSATADPTSGSAVNLTSGTGGTTVYSTGTVVLSTSVANVNDRPTAGNATLAAGVEDQQGQPAPAATASSLFGGGYSDATDNQTGIAGGGNAATPFGGIAIVGNASTSAQGAWEYSTDNGASWTAVPLNASDTSATLLAPNAQLRFVPAADYNGAPGALTVRVSDTAVVAGTGDISATVASQTSTWSTVHTLATSVAPRNDAPVLAGTPTNATATENGQTGTGISIPPTALLTGASVADLDLATTPGLATGTFGAGSITVSLDGYQPGDVLLVDGSLPAGVTVSGGAGAALLVQFDADTTVAEVQAVLNALSYRSTSDNPTNYGADTDRVYTIIVNDGNNVQAGGNAGGPALNSNVLTGTLTIVATNDAPTANDDTHAIAEDVASVASNVITGRVAGQGDTDLDNLTLTVGAVRTGPEAGSGTAGTVGSPLAGNYGSVVLNADGSYTYSLNNADPRVQALVAGETLTEVYTYTVSDGAGGTDTAQLTITITGAANGGGGDDVPSITVPDQNAGATGHLTVNESGLTGPGDTSETAGSTFAVAAADGLASITVNGTLVSLAQLQAATPGAPVIITSAAGELRITGFTPTATVGALVTAGDVSYSYTLVQPQNHAGGEVTDPFALVVTDRDGDVANGTLTVLIVDDAPVAANDTASITEDAAPGTVSGDLKINDRNGADNSNTVPVTAVSFGATAGTVGAPLALAYGSVVVNADGSYTYTLDNNNATVNALKDGETLTETVSYTITDADGDTSIATLTITINGHTDLASGPSIVPVDGNGAATGQAEVFERGLTDGAGGADASEGTGGTISISAADGLASVTVGGSTLTVAQLQALGTTPRTIDTGEGTLVLTGFTATSTVGGVPTAGELSYIYTLKNPIGQPGATESADPVALQVTDAGGATSTGTLQVRIVDDTPQAVNDSATITEDGTPNTVSGSVKANDTDGADNANGVPVTAVSFGASTGSVGSPLTTAYGSIVVNADGSYTYTLDNANPAVQHLLPGETLTETVNYTITDADGDTAAATLTITIGGRNDGVVLSLTDGNGAGTTGQATVSERGLGDGGDASETTTGTFVVRTPDGLGSIDVGGTTLTPAQLASLGSSPIVIATDKGLITLTGFDPATGTVSYSYTLTGHQQHGGSEVTDDIAVTVRDRDGDTTSGTLRVLVLDDVPTARDDAASLGTALPGATVKGNLPGLAGQGTGDVADRLGADAVAEPVIGFSFEGRAGVVGGPALAGAYGSLRLNADGSYTYAVNDSNTRVASLGDGQTLTEVFSYTITDADGSTSTAQLVVTIRGASQFRPLAGDQIFPVQYPSEQRHISQGMTPALFIELSVRESQHTSQSMSARIATRVAGGASRTLIDDIDLFGIRQDMGNVEHVGRDGVGFSLRMLGDVQQALAQRGLGAGLPDGSNALFGDFADFAAPAPETKASEASKEASAPRESERIVVSGAAAAPRAPTAGRPVSTDTARSFTARLAASAGERGTVRDVVRVQQRDAVRVKVPAAPL
ncbi:cadherin-like domain-containing protein [Variovorax sp. J22G47]|nr:cadherin-like domain-containing protein [Variovorax sp. J22G47]